MLKAQEKTTVEKNRNPWYRSQLRNL